MKRSKKIVGGSVASNAVSSLANQTTYTNMNNHFINRVGGSVASNSVSSLVKPNTYATMNSTFSNNTGGSAKKKGGSANSNNASIWQKVINEFSQHFTQAGGKKVSKAAKETRPPKQVKVKPVKPITTTTKKLKGGKTEFMHLSDYNDSWGANVFNKKGGGDCEAATIAQRPVGLNYSAIQTQGSVKGISYADAPVNKMVDVITDNTVSGNFVPSLNKSVNFGNSPDIFPPWDQVRVPPFSYGGLMGGSKQKQKINRSRK